MPTVAAIIIGNEILSGKFADENGPFLIRRLRALGADLRRVVTIPDTLDAIAAEVRAAAQAFDLVVTSGGVGPTHDDLTFDGVARAFDRPVAALPALVALLERYGLPTHGANLRMASPPAGAELVAIDRAPFPVVRVENVYILPGVPKLFRAKFEAIADAFRGEAVVARRVYLNVSESSIADALTVVAAAHPSVDIGSYPRWDAPNFQVILTLEGRDEHAVHAAEAHLHRVFPTVDAAEPA
jgi:molybdenum cofactor synthesis domain-containing protein